MRYLCMPAPSFLFLLLHNFLEAQRWHYFLGAGLKAGINFRGQVWKRVWKLMTFLVWNRVRIWRTERHNVPHQKFLRIPPPPPRKHDMMPFFEGGRPLTSFFVLALTAICHLRGYSFQSQCSVWNRWLSIEPRTSNVANNYCKDHLGKLQRETAGSWCQDQQCRMIL